MLKKLTIASLALLLVLAFLMGCRPPEVEGVVVNMQHGLYDKAFELAQEAVKKYPDNAEAWFYLGVLYLQKKEYTNMNDAFNKVLATNPTQTVTYEGKSVPADRAINAIRLTTFADLYNTGTANFNKAREVEDEATQQKLYQAAVENYKKAMEVLPERVEPLRPLAAASLVLGDTLHAEQYLEDAITREPQNDTLMVIVADFYLQIGKLDKSEQLYLKAIEINPNYTDAYLALGQLQTMKKNWEKAVYYFEKSLEMNPDNPDVLFNIGISLYNAEKYAEAIPYLQKVVDLETDNEEVYEILAISYIQAEKNQEALPFLEKAVEKFPNSSSLWNYLAIVYSRLGMKEKALEAFNKSKELEGM